MATGLHHWFFYIIHPWMGFVKLILERMERLELAYQVTPFHRGIHGYLYAACFIYLPRACTIGKVVCIDTPSRWYISPCLAK